MITRNTVHAALALCACATPLSLASAPAFHPIGTLGPQGDGFDTSSITALSADGLVAVGLSTSPLGNRAVRWTLDGGLIALPSLPGGGFFDRAEAISADGTTIYGSSSSAAAPGGEATAWTIDGPSPLGSLNGTMGSSALAVSADGLNVVGASGTDGFVDPPRATRWTNGGGAFEIPGPNSPSSATGVSADGSTIVGQMAGGFVDGITAGFVWTPSGTTKLQDLATTPPFDPGAGATGISDDGSTIIGWATDQTGPHAVRWDTDGNVTALGGLPGSLGSTALATTPDGSIIVGVAESALKGPEAFIWTETEGMKSLDALLRQMMPEDLAGWTIGNATAISNDGLTFAGVAIGPDGIAQGYVATIPAAPVAAIILAPLGARLRRRR